MFWSFTAQSPLFRLFLSQSIYITALPGQAYTYSKWLTSTVHMLLPETDNCPSWIIGRERMIPQKNVAPAVFEPATSWNCQKKSACKINENDLKIAWKCTLRQSSVKNFPGRPRTLYKRGHPAHTLLLSWLTPLDTMPPRLQTFWVQLWWWSYFTWNFYEGSWCKLILMM